MTIVHGLYTEFLQLVCGTVSDETAFEPIKASLNAVPAGIKRYKINGIVNQMQILV